MAHRNRWFTVLKNGGSFHGNYVSHNQMVCLFLAQQAKLCNRLRSVAQEGLGRQ